MSPNDRTAREIATVKKALAAGTMAPIDAAEKIAMLEKRGPAFEATWTLPNGKERVKTFSVAKYGKRAERMAAEYEAEQSGKVRRREHDDPHTLRTTVAEVLDYYLETRMKGRTSFKNARAHRNNIIEVWGDRLTLEKLDRSPDELIGMLRDRLEEDLEEKSAWNNKVTAQAAINHFLTRHRHRMINPFMGFDWPMPSTERKERITSVQHRQLVKAAHGAEFPAWVAVFFEMGWETGWRSGEIGDWHWERITLDPAGEEFPWIHTLVQKQGKAKKGAAAPVVYEDKPISFRAARLLRAMQGTKEAGPVWILKRTMRDRWVRRVFLAAGLDDLRFHDYRRSMKRRMEEAGVSNKGQMDYSGHKTQEMQDRYNYHNRADLEQVLRKLEPQDQGPKNT